MQGQEHVLSALHFDREERVGRRGFDVLHGAEFEGRHTVFARFVPFLGRFGQSLSVDEEKAESREGAERRNRFFVLGRPGIEGIVDRVSHEFARSGVAVHAVEREQGRFAPFETIVFEEERHIQPVDFEEHIVGFTAVEDIVGEMHFDFAVDAVRAGESPDGENVGI